MGYGDKKAEFSRILKSLDDIQKFLDENKIPTDLRYNVVIELEDYALARGDETFYISACSFARKIKKLDQTRKKILQYIKNGMSKVE